MRKATLVTLNVLIFCSLLISGVLSAIPVIVDTDFGSVVDDTWGLGLLLASPEVDVKLIVTSTQNTTQRTQVVAKFLTEVGRSDIPIAMGVNTGENIDGQYPYAENFDLNSYNGNISENGAQAMIDLINLLDEVVVLELSPASTFAQAIIDEPSLVRKKVRVVAMSGSIYLPQLEYNVVDNITASQIMYDEQYYLAEMITAPLDTCGYIFIGGSYYRQLVEAQETNALVRNILENYRIWSGEDFHTSSSILYDAQAARMVYSLDFLNMEHLKVSVNNTGYTVIDANGNPIFAATSWEDGGMLGWQSDVTERLLSWPQSK